MADGDAIDKYVRELEASLRRAGRPTEPLVDEARAHLHEDAARIAAAEGCGDAEAARRAIARFGVVGEVMRAVRRNSPIVAATLARIASIAVLLVLVWEVFDAIRGGDLWPLTREDLWLTFVAELAVVSVVLWRAVRGARVPAWLGPALAANGALGLALFVAETVVSSRLPSWPIVSVSRAGSATPLWLAMAVQGAAGLRALRQQATQVGQPSLPVELQPPG
jgi:hypothetical protein